MPRSWSIKKMFKKSPDSTSKASSSNYDNGSPTTNSYHNTSFDDSSNSSDLLKRRLVGGSIGSTEEVFRTTQEEADSPFTRKLSYSSFTTATADKASTSTTITTPNRESWKSKSVNGLQLTASSSSTSNLYTGGDNPEQPSVSSGVGTYVEKVITSLDNSTPTQQPTTATASPAAGLLKLNYVSLDFIQSCRAKSKEKLDISGSSVGLVENGVSVVDALHGSQSSVSSSFISSVGISDDDDQAGSTVGSEELENLYAKMRRQQQQQTRVIVGSENDVDFPQQQALTTADCDSSSNNNNNNGNQLFASVKSAVGNTLCSNKSATASGVEKQSTAADDKCTDPSAQQRDPTSDRDVPDGEPSCSDSYQVIVDADYCSNNLTEFPTTLWQYSHTLKKLVLESNSIENLPNELFACHQLEFLSVSDNDISEVPPALASLVNLNHLDLSKNVISNMPDSIRHCKNLRVLDMSVNPLERLADCFTQLINLTELFMIDCFFEFLPSSIGRMCNLRVLELRDNQLQNLPKSMRKLTQLERLDLGGNVFQDWPDVICHLENLAELWLDANDLCRISLDIGKLTKMIYLDLSHNLIDVVPSQIGKLTMLRDLVLSDNNISQLPDTIGFVSRLSTLNMATNQLSEVPASMGKLRQLTELDLQSNQLTIVPASIGNLQQLRTLLLDENQLTEVPREIGSCKCLNVLQLSSNKITFLPDTVGNLNNLRVLNVCRNLLPHLPSSILKLNLNALWMSANQSKPDFPLELLYDQTTNKRFLTNCLFPQDQLHQRQYARKGASNIQEINARWLEDETQDELIDMADDASPHNRQRGKTLVAFNLDISYNSECSVSPVETSESEDEGHYQTNAEYLDDEVREESVVNDTPTHQQLAAASVVIPGSILRHNHSGDDIHDDNGDDDDFSVFINDQNVKKSSQNLHIHVATSPPSDGDDTTTSIMTSPTASTVSKTTTTATSTPNNKEEVEIEVMTSSLYTVKPGIKQWSSYQNLLQLSSDHIPIPQTTSSNTAAKSPPPPPKDDKAKKFRPDILQQKASSSSTTQAVVEVDKSPPCSSLLEFEPYNQVPPVPHHLIQPANNDLDSGVGNDVESQESLPDEHAISTYAPAPQRPPVPPKKATLTTDKNKVFKNINKFEKILATTATESPPAAARLPPPIAPKPTMVATNKPALNDQKDQAVEDVTLASKHHVMSFRDKLDRLMQQKPTTAAGGLSNVASSKRAQRSYEKLRRITSPVPSSFNTGGGGQGGHAFDNLTAESDQTTSPTSDHSVHMRIRQRLSNSSNGGENELLERSSSRNQQRLLYRNSKAMDNQAVKQVDEGKTTLEEQLGQLLLDGDETYKGHHVVYDQQNGTTIHGTALNLGGHHVEKTAPTRDERPADWRNQLLDHIERKKAEKQQQVHDMRHVRRYHSTTDEISPVKLQGGRQRAASTRMLRTRTPGPEQSMDYINSMYNIDLLNRPKSAMGVVTMTSQQLDYPSSSQEEKTVSATAADTRSYYHRNKQRSRSPVNHINHRHSSGTTHKIAPPSYEDHMLRKASSRQQIDINRVASVSPPPTSTTAGYFPLRSTGSHESVLHINSNEKQVYKPQQPHHHHDLPMNVGKLEMKAMRASNSHDSLLDTSHLHHYYQPTTHHHIPYNHHYHPPPPQHKKPPPPQQPDYNGGYMHHNTRQLPPQQIYYSPTSYPSGGGGYHDNYAYPNNMYHPHHHRRAPQQQRSGGGGNYSDLYNQQQVPPPQQQPPQRNYQQQQTAYSSSSSNYHQSQPQKQQQQRKYNKEEDSSVTTSAFRPYHETPHPGSEQQPTTTAPATSGYQPSRQSNRNQSVYQSKRYQQQQQANNNKPTTQQSRRSVAMPPPVAVQPSHMSSEDQTTMDNSESSWTTDYHGNGGYPHHHAIDASSSDNKIEIIRVTVRKNPTFGFHIMGGIDAGENPYRKDDNGVFITFVQPQGSADGQVRQGDKILMVNGSDFVGIKHKRAVDLLRNAGQTACLVLERIVPRSTSGRPV